MQQAEGTIPPSLLTYFVSVGLHCVFAWRVLHPIPSYATGVLHFQLKETPADFFVDIVSRDNFLTVTLQSFFSTVLTAPGVDATVRCSLMYLATHSACMRAHWFCIVFYCRGYFRVGAWCCISVLTDARCVD